MVGQDIYRGFGQGDLLLASELRIISLPSLTNLGTALSPDKGPWQIISILTNIPSCARMDLEPDRFSSQGSNDEKEGKLGMSNILSKSTRAYSAKDIKLIHERIIKKVALSGVSDREIKEAARKALEDVRRTSRSNSG